MDITSKLMLLFGTIGVIILILQVFGVFDPIKGPENNSTTPEKITSFPLIRGDGGAPKKLTPNAEVPKGPKVYKRHLPATRIIDKKVAFFSGEGNVLRSKFKLTEDGRAAIRRGNIKFIRELAA